MNKLVIISITYLLILSPIGIEKITNEVYAKDKNSNDKYFEIKTGTVCSDKTDQLAVSLNGTIIPPPPRCWNFPDVLDELHDLEGGSKSDMIYGLEGHDVIKGEGGDDILDGGNGDDTIIGGEGNDNLFGSLDNDYISGENGDDLLVGSFGNDLLSGGGGNDELFGNQGNDVLSGGDSADFFDCGEDIDIVLDFNAKQGDKVSETCERVMKSTIQ